MSINNAATAESIRTDSYVLGKIGWRSYITLSSLLLIMVWFGIDTGPWVLRQEPSGLLGWFHAVRTVLPITVLLLGTIIGLSVNS